MSRKLTAIEMKEFLSSQCEEILKYKWYLGEKLHHDPLLDKTINDIGHVMGIKTIAEYVEDNTVIILLRELGVDYAQGYAISKPAPFSYRLSDQIEDKPLPPGKNI